MPDQVIQETIYQLQRSIDQLKDENRRMKQQIEEMREHHLTVHLELTDHDQRLSVLEEE